MAEALAIVGLVAAIAQFVETSVKVSKRIHEYQQEAKDAPRVFQSIRERVPLMINLVTYIQKEVERSEIDKRTQQLMLPVVQRCSHETEKLDGLLIKILPSPNDPTWLRGRKILTSLAKESEIAKIHSSLGTNLDLLVKAIEVHRSGQTTIQNVMNVTMQQSEMSLVTNGPRPPFHQHSKSLPVRSISEPPSAAFVVPFRRDAKFVAREDILQSLEESLTTKLQISLAGLGGVGKSQIAIEFAYRYKVKNPLSKILWVFAGTTSRFEQGYEEIARRLRIPGYDDPACDFLQLVYEHLSDEASGEWLLVIDNADDEATFFSDRSESSGRQKAKPLSRYLPHSSQGRTLFTTRDKRLGERLTEREKPIEILPLHPDDGIELLRRRVDVDEKETDAARKLVEELGHLPLAITQAAAFISENYITVSEYLEMLEAGDSDLAELLSEDLDDTRRDHDTDNAVMRTWKLSFDQISKRKPRAAEILALMAVLDFHDVPKRLLLNHRESDISFRTSMGTLQAFSLITSSNGKEPIFKMHRLVALSTQKWLEAQGKKNYWRSEALNKVFDLYPQEWRFEHWTDLKILAPHASTVTMYDFCKKEEVLKCATLLDYAALYDMTTTVRYLQARDKCTRSLALRRSVLPDDDEITLRSYQTLGEALLHTGELDDARAHLETSLKGKEICLGPLHEDTLESMSDLTITLLDLDDTETAEPYALQAYASRKQTLGPEDPDTLVSLNIVALLRQRQGRLDEAMELTQNVLELRKRIEGPENPATLMTLNNLGVLHYKRGELEEASRMFGEAIIGEAKSLGADRYDAQATMTNMARVLMAMGDLSGSRQLHGRVYKLREKMYGPLYPGTVLSLKYIAELDEMEGLSGESHAMESGLRRGSASESLRRSAGALLADGLLYD